MGTLIGIGVVVVLIVAFLLSSSEPSSGSVEPTVRAGSRSRPTLR